MFSRPFNFVKRHPKAFGFGGAAFIMAVIVFMAIRTIFSWFPEKPDLTKMASLGATKVIPNPTSQTATNDPTASPSGSPSEPAKPATKPTTGLPDDLPPTFPRRDSNGQFMTLTVTAPIGTWSESINIEPDFAGDYDYYCRRSYKDDKGVFHKVKVMFDDDPAKVVHIDIDHLTASNGIVAKTFRVQSDEPNPVIVHYGYIRSDLAVKNK